MSVEDASAATKIEPRMRERRLAVRRAAGRKRVRWAIAASVLILLVVASLAVVGSGLFAVETVRVAGNEHSDQAALDAIVADLEGTPVLLVDEQSFERQVETLPWVDEARVTTRFPDRATIEIRERVPAAAFQGPDQQWRLIDQEARVLAISEAAPAGIIPVSGDDFPDAEPGQYLAQGLSDAATLARSLTPLMLARVQSISVALDRSDLRMLFTDGTEVRFGRSDDGLVQKLVRLETTLNDLGEDRVSYIDVSTNEVGTG
jgi:cell division protein FtsQ